VRWALGSHWQDLSEKVERAVATGSAAFLNVLTDCPVGWGHEPKRRSAS
jgi:pyruvate/2-oxoacid:ferredoxin oxidoreductase beta subunit